MKCTTGILLSGLLLCGAAQAQLSTWSSPQALSTSPAFRTGTTAQSYYGTQPRPYALSAPLNGMWVQNSAAVPLPAIAARPEDSSAAEKPGSDHSYRLRYTLTEFEDGKQTAEQHLTLVQIANGKFATVKLGSKVPIATSSFTGSASTGVQTQFNYYDIGTTIQASLSLRSDGSVTLSTTAEQSSIVTPPDGAMRQPIVRTAHMDATAYVKTMGEIIRIGSFDIPSSTHRIDLSVVVERVN